MKELKNERGFTLIEMLAVIVITGILLMIGTLMMQTTVSIAKQDAFISSAFTFKEAARKYALFHRIDESPVDRVTYQQLLAEGLIEQMVDPFTGDLLTAENESYVTFSKAQPEGICLYAEAHKLCDNDRLAIPFSEISRERISPN